MIRNRLWFPLLVLAAVLALPSAGLAMPRSLGMEVWTDRGDDAVYQPGEAMQVKVRSNDDAYLLVYEIDSEGHVNVLYPWRRDAGMIEARRTYRLPPEDSKYELTVEKATGQGFIVAIASRAPLRDLPWYLRPYDPQAASVGYDESQSHEDEEGFDNDGRVVGDPYVAMERIRRRVLQHASDTEAFATSYTSYYVQHEVRYPRYVCNDCHRQNRYSFWDGFDPYYTNCSVVDFRVNWNWCWGPRIWSAYVPYYYYVVREDCPPHYQPWYNDHSRFSSWDGYQKWNNLWGGNLIRTKPPTPPQGYIPPQPRGGYNPAAPPPGYLYTNVEKRGFRVPTPIGRDGQPRGDAGDGSRGTFRGKDDNVTRLPVTRAPMGDDGNATRPQWRDKRQASPQPASRPPVEDGGGRGGYAPHREPARREPANEAPRQDPPRQERREPARYDPPRQERREPTRYDPPRQERRESPRFEPPRQAPPRQEPARQEPPKQEPRREPEHRDKGGNR